MSISIENRDLLPPSHIEFKTLHSDGSADFEINGINVRIRHDGTFTLTACEMFGPMAIVKQRAVRWATWLTLKLSPVLRLGHVFSRCNHDFKSLKFQVYVLSNSALGDFADDCYAYRHQQYIPSLTYHRIASVVEAETAKRRRGPGHVYIIQSGELCKIGFSRYVHERIKKLTRKFGEIEVIHTIKSDDARTLERHLHDEFRQFKDHGEWFMLSEDHLEWLQTLSYCREL